MIPRAISILNVMTAGLLAIIAAGAVYFAGTAPIAFQKIMALRPQANEAQDWSKGKPLDVARFIGAIPYRSSEGVAEVHPERLYEKTVLEGRGNCANKSRGLSFYLNRSGIPFERVDLLPFDGYLEGKGHTVVRARYVLDGQDRVGIIDMLEGGVLVKNDRLVDLDDLRYAPPYSITIVPLNSRTDDGSDYYGSFIETAAVSVTPTEQTKRFFRFIEAVYVPFGDARLERLVYNAIAVVLGIFPRHYVSEEDYARLLDGNGHVQAIAQTLTWSARVLLLCVVLQVVLRAWLIGTRIASRRSDRALAPATSPASSPAASPAAFRKATEGTLAEGAGGAAGDGRGIAASMRAPEG